MILTTVLHWTLNDMFFLLDFLLLISKHLRKKWEVEEIEEFELVV